MRRLLLAFVSLALTLTSIAAAASEENPPPAETALPKYRHAITFVHPHTATNLIAKRSGVEPQLLTPTDIQLAQTTDFGTFRLQYSYQDWLWGFSPWIAIGGNLHKGFVDYPSAAGAQKTELTAKVGIGILAGIAYRVDLGRRFYFMPLAGYGHYFSSQIDVNFPTATATQDNGCHEICVTGSVESLLYGALIGVRITRFLAFELGLEHNLFFSRRQQSLSDGTNTATITGSTGFSDALMFSFGFTYQFNL